jgi:hypothetical protein
MYFKSSKLEIETGPIWAASWGLINSLYMPMDIIWNDAAISSRLPYLEEGHGRPAPQLPNCRRLP